MFNVDDYNDNIEYCRYVFDKNIELDLGLSSPAEIQYVANQYLDTVCARRGFMDDEVYENDKILTTVAEKAIKKINRLKNKTHETQEEIDMGINMEKQFNSHGGYGFNDSYDDFYFLIY